MRTYILKRLLLIPPTLFGITLISFMLMKLAPGSPEAMRVGRLGGTEAAIEGGQLSAQAARRWREERHLDKPWHIQYVYMVRDLASGRLETFESPPRPVMQLIWERLPITIVLNVVAFFLIYTIAIPLGIICAVRHNSWLDRVLTVVVFLLYSLPSFWVAQMMLIFLCDPQKYAGKIFPATGVPTAPPEGLGPWLMVWGWHLTLPVLCLTYAGYAFLSRQMRGALLEQIRQDYVRTARAKGLPGRVVILKHAVRNSLIPIVTLFGTLLPAMVAGSVIIESIFSIKGMGMLFLEAILKRDYNILMMEIALIGVLTMLGILISDLLYALVDPRVTLERGSG